MTYRGFEIVLERQTCEFFSLDDNGYAAKYLETCYDEAHTNGVCEFIARDSDTGERFIGAESIETLKAYIDKVLNEAKQALAGNVNKETEG